MFKPKFFLVTVKIVDPRSGLEFEETERVRADFMTSSRYGMRGKSDADMEQAAESFNHRLSRMAWRCYGLLVRNVENEANRLAEQRGLDSNTG